MPPLKELYFTMSVVHPQPTWTRPQDKRLHSPGHHINGPQGGGESITHMRLRRHQMTADGL